MLVKQTNKLIRSNTKVKETLFRKNVILGIICLSKYEVMISTKQKYKVGKTCFASNAESLNTIGYCGYTLKNLIKSRQLLCLYVNYQQSTNDVQL